MSLAFNISTNKVPWRLRLMWWPMWHWRGTRSRTINFLIKSPYANQIIKTTGTNMSVCLTSSTSPSLLHPSPTMSRALSCTPMTRGAMHLLAPCPSQPPPLLPTLSPLLPVHAGHACHLWGELGRRGHAHRWPASPSYPSRCTLHCHHSLSLLLAAKREKKKKICCFHWYVGLIFYFFFGAISTACWWWQSSIVTWDYICIGFRKCRTLVILFSIHMTCSLCCSKQPYQILLMSNFDKFWY